MQSDRVTTDQQRPGATDFAAFPSVVALDHMECLGVLIQSQSEVLNFHVEVAAPEQLSSQVRSMPCPTARFLPMNVGSFTPFDLDGKYRLKVTEWRGMSILRSIAAMQVTKWYRALTNSYGIVILKQDIATQVSPSHRFFAPGLNLGSSIIGPC